MPIAMREAGSQTLVLARIYSRFSGGPLRAESLVMGRGACWTVASLLTTMAAGCAATVEPGDEVPLEEPVDKQSAAVVTGGPLCVYACGGAAAAGCAAVALACTAGAVWTFGGVAIPCQYAVIAACYAIGAAGAACPQICGAK